MTPSIRLLAVDGLNLIRRVYAAQPGDDGPEKAKEGRTASGQSLERALRETSPTHALVVFEGPGATWRHRLFPGYKASHKPMPDELRIALPEYRDAFAALGVPSFELPETEADDVIGTLAIKTAAAGERVVILSTDKTFFQLLSQSVSVRDHFNRADRDRDYVVERFGVEPASFVDFLGLAGDSTNSIAGVPGVGPKTASQLIGTFGSLEGVLAAAELPGSARTSMSAKLAEKLVAHAKDARLAQRLVRLTTDLELGLNLRSLRYQDPA